MSTTHLVTLKQLREFMRTADTMERELMDLALESYLRDDARRADTAAQSIADLLEEK